MLQVMMLYSEGNSYNAPGQIKIKQTHTAPSAQGNNPQYKAPLNCTCAMKNKAQGQRDFTVPLIMQNMMTAANQRLGK